MFTADPKGELAEALNESLEAEGMPYRAVEVANLNVDPMWGPQLNRDESGASKEASYD